jgi:putative membrane protein
METLSIILVALVAIEHIYILVLEMFLWHKPRTQKIFSIDKKDVETTKVMAANQGLYNGFLAAGLLWGFAHSSTSFGLQIQFFFLIFIVVAALYGGLTVKKSIMLVQGLPAFLAILGLIFAHA